MSGTTTVAGPGRIAGAPAAWGICELPDWGYQLEAERVLAEMSALGLPATELGPDGFIAGSPRQQRALLARFGLRPLGAFCPLVLHEPSVDLETPVQTLLGAFAELGADLMVIAAASGSDTYDSRPELSDTQWDTLTANLTWTAERAAAHGVTACFHPHIGTLIQTGEEVDRVLGACAVPMCLDTGHLTVAGADPVAIARRVPDRIAHVHLKDVDHGLADAVQAGRMDYSEAVREAMYTPLGGGDVDLAGLVNALEESGYQGWYVPEVDQMLPGDPGDGGPILGMRTSIAFLEGLGLHLPAGAEGTR